MLFIFNIIMLNKKKKMSTCICKINETLKVLTTEKRWFEHPGA